jgi:phosphatidate cytidylyltransferase
MLKQRIVTAIVAGAGLLLVLFVLPASAALGVVIALMLAAAWEWSGLLGAPGLAARLAYVAVIALLLAFVTLRLSDAASVALILKIGLAWWFAALVWVFFYPTPIAMPVRWLCGALVMVPAYIALVSLYSFAPAILLFALGVVWSADVGAFFAGRRFGRVKLAPLISPGKTWEGVIGGLAAVVLLLVAARLAGLEMDVAVVIPFCLAVATLSIVGDLTVSMFKRNAGVKDSGTLFPGHGGVLDRIDSVAAAAPLFALGLGWIGLV